jgi:ectoine hydroxylase-related dioxygenase (phytanoyl-CoA dioxygenase family)
LQELLDTAGFAVVRKLLYDTELEVIRDALSRDDPRDANQSGAARVRRGSVFARRNLLCIPAVRSVIAQPAVGSLVRHVLGKGARAVRAILFDKTPDANWLVPWHQDLSIAVRERRDVAGFGPWSVKAGVHHVQPPVEILERMLAVRIHLDDCPEANGPLRVIPGSHRALWTPTELERLVSESQAVTCCADAGDALLVRPMLVHTSAPSRTPGHRRVIHIEYAACALPGGLEWHFSVET